MKNENRKTNKRLSKYRNRKFSYHKGEKQIELKNKDINPKSLASKKWRNKFDWRSPRVSGAIAGILLCVMLITGIISAIPKAQAEENTVLTPTWQLAKEYIYAGGRMLAIEDYGISSTETPTPTPTPEETPTPTPPIATCPEGYTSLDGVIIGSPAATVFNNTLFVFVRGTDNAIYYRKTTDGSNYESYSYLGGYLISDPSTLVTYDTLYVEATGGDDQRYLRSTTDGSNFADWVGSSVGAQTSASAYFNGNTYTFVQGGGTQPPLCVKSELGGTPTPTITPPPTPTPTPTETPTPTPTPTPSETYTLAEEWNGNRLFIDWTASVSRPAFTDKVVISPASNYSIITFERYTSGGTSGQINVTTTLSPGDYAVRYLKDGTTEMTVIYVTAY